MKQLISVVAPMYNEEALVFQYCKEMLTAFDSIATKYDLELVLVNDGSTDKSLEKIEKIYDLHRDNITVVNLSRNFGLEGAIKAGLEVASGCAVIVMDADLQDPPFVVLQMIAEWEQGVDIVTGSRSSRPSDTFFKRFTAKMFYKTLGTLSGKLKLETEAANFRLLSRKAVDKLLSLRETNCVFRVLVPYLGMKASVVYYERDRRFAGETKYKLSSMIRYALDSLTGISVEPLRKLFYFAVLSGCITCALLIGACLVVSNLKAFFLVAFIVSFFFTLLFLALSVIGEYIGQIYVEAKARPTSIIYEVKKGGLVDRGEVAA